MKNDNSPYQLWDKLFKVIGDRFPDEIVRFIFPDKQVKLCGKYEQEKISIEYQIADINFWISDQGKRKLLNIEPYSSWDSTIPGLVFTRNAIITKSLDYKYEVISVVILLEKKDYSGSYEVRFEDKVINQFLFPVVSFKDIESILEKFPPLAPFILKVDQSYQNKVIKIVKGDKILTAVTALVLNWLGYSKEEALQMLGDQLQEFKQALLEVPLMQDVFKEWEEKGKQEGRKDGVIEGSLKSLVKILRHLGEIPIELHEQLNRIEDIEKMDSLIDLAITCTSLDEFKAQMSKDKKQ